MGNTGLKGTERSTQIIGAGPYSLGLNPVLGTNLGKFLSVSEEDLQTWSEVEASASVREYMSRFTQLAQRAQHILCLDVVGIVTLPGPHPQLIGS